MKKRLVILTGTFIAIMLVGLGANHLMSLRKVTFTLSSAVEGMVVYSSNEQEVERFTASGHTLLREGKYFIIPEGDTISKDKIDFTVGSKDAAIEVDPNYSKGYLENLLKQERVSIEEAVSDRYSDVFNDYNLTNHTLYMKGEWFGGLLQPKVSSAREQKDPYRIVLHKDNGKWKVIRRPEYVLTASRYEEVPIDVLRDINALVQ